MPYRDIIIFVVPKLKLMKATCIFMCKSTKKNSSIIYLIDAFCFFNTVFFM